VVVVDTSVWIDFFRSATSPETDWLDRELGRQRLALLDLHLFEVLQGVRNERQLRETERLMTRLPVLTTGGADLAIAAAANYRLLRSLGITVRAGVDCLIATYCIQNRHSLLHNDRDFDAFERHAGLGVVHP
jgi:predicted nucleic acid-binding protein